jgi:DNA-binding SARP family transcriptional activator/class 3 adenylate cyclase
MVPLGGPRPRAVLAVLALHANQPVSAERLALALWGEDAPPSAVKTVQVNVARLRKALGDPDLLATTPAGYCLRVGPGELDAERFERQVADGRRALAAGRGEEAAAKVRAALELWRGPPLAELASTPFAPVEIARLEEQHLAALELRVEADLAAGRHAELVGELQQLTSRHPWRERLHAQRMLALYRSGRQGEALEAYREAREALVDQLGVEPGAELHDLHEAILAHAPGIDAPPDASSQAAEEGDGRHASPGALGGLSAPSHRTVRREDDVAAVGTVTLLFTDLVGSTELLERIGDDEAERLRRLHFGLLRDVLAVRGGHEVKSLGDGLMVVFASAVGAVGCAVAMQQAVRRHNRRQPGLRLGVRIGLHVGDPISDEDDYFGTPVVIARRLCDAAEGGQILTSELVQGIVGSRGGHRFRPVGDVALKGIATPVAAREIVWDAPRASPVPLPPALIGGDGEPLAGRGEELAALSEHFARARAGERQMVLMCGEPGVGKTRLASELGRRAHAEGAIVLYGRCDAEPLTPHQPFVEALGHYVELAPIEELAGQVAAAGGELRRIVPELERRLPRAPQPVGGDPAGERFRLFDAVATLLVEASAASPLLLILDDLHWADNASVLLLRHVARDSRTASLLVLCSYRQTEALSSSPLEQALADLVTERRFARRRLAGLDESGVAAMIEAHVGERNPLVPAQRLHAHTGGNPFFVGEVLRSLAGHAREEIELALRSDELELPESVRQLIEQRVARLGDEVRRVLTIAAVVGSWFDLRVLEHVSGRPLDELLEALERATVARLVEESPDAVGRFAFAHALIRDTLYLGLGAARRARLHHLVGEALETLAAASPEPPLADLAYHFANAADAADADPSKAVRYSLLAAGHALRQLAYEQAALEYERALAALQLQPEVDARERAELLVALGQARWRAGERERAREAFLAAAELARERDDGTLLGRAALGLGGEWLRVDNVDDALLELGEDALSRIGDSDPRLRVRLQARVAAELVNSPGQERRRDELSADAVQEARRLGDPATLAAALNARHIAIWVANPAERLGLATELLAAAEQGGERELVMVGHAWRYADLCELGDIVAAERELDACEREAQALRQPLHRWTAHRLRAALTIFRGDLAEGERLANEALQIGMRAQAPSARADYAGQLVAVRSLQGRVGELIEPARAFAADYAHLPGWPIALASMYAWIGEDAEARRLLAPLAANRFASIPQNSNWATCLASAAIAVVLLDERAWAQALYELLLPHARLNVSGGGGNSPQLGPAAMHLGALAATTGRHEAAAKHFEDALEANARMGAKPWEALTRCEYGRMLLAHGDPDDRPRAEQLLTDAHATADALGLGALLERIPRTRA